MWEPFQESARLGIVLAQEEAHRLNHSHIGTEHLLLGILAGGDSGAAKALQNQGVGLEPARELVQQIVGAGDPSSTEMVFSSHAKGSIEKAFEEARKLGHNAIALEHLLLGVMGLPKSTGATILTRLEVDFGKLREELAASLPVQQPEPVLFTPSPLDEIKLEVAALRAEVEQLKRAVEELRQGR